MKGLFPASVAAAVALACASTVVLAQETTSSVRGSVATPDGAVISGATVTIVHTPSGTTSTTTTGSSGSFSAPGLRPGGPYRITVSAAGHPSSTLEGVYLGAGEPLNVPVVLGAGAGADEVLEEAVVYGTARVQSAGPTTTLDRNAIEGVASVQRDIRDIARRDPFASFNPTTRGVSIAGTNNRGNRFAVDGLHFSDSFGLNQGGMPTTRGPVPLDAVEQLSVRVAPYDISEGDLQGGSINVVLRSGGNDFTGSAFYTYTDDALTGEKSRGVPVNLDFSSKNYGAFVSGPILENKLFFALAYENLDQGEPAGVGLVGWPTPIPTITQQEVDEVSAIAQSVYGYDTLGLRLSLPETDKKYTGKLDWNINDFHRLSYTGIFQKTLQQSPSTGFATPTNSPALNYAAYATNEPEKVNSSSLQLNSQWTDVFSTEARLYFRNYSKIPSLRGPAGFPQIQVCLDDVQTGSYFQCTTDGTGRLFFGTEQFSQADVVKGEQKGAELVARLNLGSHALKAQAALAKVDITNVFVQSALGVYYVDSVAGLASGQADQLVNWQYSITGDLADVSASFGYDQYTFGLQDSWNILPGLNLTYGVRLDDYKSSDRPPENANFVTRYGFSNTHTIDGNSVLQPRVSLTWQPLDRVRVRAGFGLFNGGSPAVFLGNSFSVASVYANSVGNITRTATGCTLGTTSTSPVLPADVCAAALDDLGGTPLHERPALFNYLATNTASLAAAPVNAQTEDFDLPSTWKANLSFDYTADLGPLGDGWNLGADFYQTWVKDGVLYTDLRLEQIGTLPDGRPRYRNPFDSTTNFDLLLSNDGRGKSTIAVARINKAWDSGWSAGLAYAHQDVKTLADMSNATYANGGTTGNGTYGASPMIDPNVAAYGRSVWEIKHNWKLNLDFQKAFVGGYRTRLSWFAELRSGTPYNLGMRDAGGSRAALFGTIQSNNTTDRRYMLYVPDVSAQDADPLVSYANTATYEAFRDFVLEEGLTQGRIVKKNSGTAPDFFKVDFHLEQELPMPFVPGAKLNFFADVENFLNLLNSRWGSFRAVDPLQAIVTVACAVPDGNSCSQYAYSSFARPAVHSGGSSAAKVSLWNLRLGFRVQF